MHNPKPSYKLHCSAPGDVKTTLVKFSKKIGYTGLSSLITEACYLYFNDSQNFQKIILPKSSERQVVRNNIQYDTGKYKSFVYDKFKALAEKNYTPLSLEFSRFIYLLYFNIQKAETLPYPEFITDIFPIAYLDKTIPELRQKKYLIEFYNLVRIFRDKGQAFKINITDFCHILLLFPENYSKYNYINSVRNKMFYLRGIVGYKIHLKFNSPDLIIRCESFPYLFEDSGDLTN